MRLSLKYLFLLLLPLQSVSQNSDYKATKHEDKYFISAYYGVGAARWKSKFDNTELFDRKGNVVMDKNSSFKAKSSTSSYSFDVLAPVSVIRLGLGMSFENFRLDKLSHTVNGSDISIPFQESFRFDKISAIIEVPIKNKKEDKPYTININTRFGFYGFSNLQSANLFGGPFFGRPLFIGVGCLADYEVFPHIYLFAYPNFEYKYFSSSKEENPSIIKHQIYSANIVGGIRINVNK